MERDRVDALYRTAEAQLGFFTAAQAHAAGYSARLLSHHTARGRFERRAHGVYRLVHFPEMTNAEDLVVHWLWSQRQGVYTHETALQLHLLSDAMPAYTVLSLPSAWQRRRLRVPAGVRLRYADLGEGNVVTVRGVPATTPARTVEDCAAAHVEPHLVGQALREGIKRRLFTARDVPAAGRYVREQGG